MNVKRLKVYLDTSIINWCVSDDPMIAKEKEATLKIVERINAGEYEGYISELVIGEINRCKDDKKREKLNQCLKGMSLEVLSVSDEAKKVAEKYVLEKIIPERYLDDALHIAMASINEIGIILSWNFEHMVKMKTRHGVKAVNELLGYPEVEIVTPEEV
jgi:predicted nucleic acid-binding protein